MAIDSYFDEEMKYLYDEGKNFAKAFPRQAKYLNIDSVDDRDPYIERLFEGVAFLTAGIREKLDGTLPELTGGVVEVLWPGLRADFPSSTIVEFKSKGAAVTSSMTLSHGSKIVSTAVGENSEKYRFKTTQDIKIHPVVLDGISTNELIDGKFKVSFKFKISANAELDKIDMDNLKLYVHGEEQEALALHFFLTTTKSRATIKVSNSDFSVFKKSAILPVGFSKDEALCKEFRDSLRSMNTLKEYFYYPEKFRFISLEGIDVLKFSDLEERAFEYELVFDKKPPVGMVISIDKLRLYCSPAINLFSEESEVINDNGKKREHFLSPSFNIGSSRIHSIVSVEGKEKDSGEIIKYQPYYSYEESRAEALYHYNYRPSDKFGKDIYLSLIRPKFLDNKKLRRETVVAKVNCSNGVLPRDTIREGDISIPGRDFPDYAIFKNITRPSQPASGVSDNKTLWVFQSMITSVFNSFGEIERLKSFLKIFNNEENSFGLGKIDSIEKAKVTVADEIIGSTALRGFLLTLTIKESGFSGDGDINMFGIILLNFVKGFVSINSFARLKINLYPSGRTLEFSPDRGDKWQI